MNFKHRWIELSQNVDRDLDTRNWGIVGCLTPSGIPFDTYRGGPVFGKEVLALQGIPAEKLLLNKENSRKLQDLAGNAMTTTVVGAAIFSAIMASTKQSALRSEGCLQPNDSMFKEFDEGPDLLEFQQGTGDGIVNKLGGDLNHLHLRKEEASFEQVASTMQTLREVASKTLQLCRCEGVSESRNSGFSICQDCGHTCCTKCQGNPRHNYIPLNEEIIRNRLQPQQFKQILRHTVPPSIQFLDTASSESLISRLYKTVTSRDTLAERRLDPAHVQSINHAVVSALQSNLHLQAIKRGRMWRLTFESASAILELRFSPRPSRGLYGMPLIHEESIECVWLLFVKSPAEENVDSPVRHALRDPIARMSPTGESIFDGVWEFRNPDKGAAKLSINPGDDFIESWETKLGLQGKRFTNARVPAQLNIGVVSFIDTEVDHCLNSIIGTYSAYQDCGAANGSLYAKGGKEKDMFLFLDPVSFGNAHYDKFVFARDHARLPDGVSRQVTASISEKWRPVRADTLAIPIDVQIDKWIHEPNLKLHAHAEENNWRVFTPRLESSSIIESLDCHSLTRTFVFHVPSSTETESIWKSNTVNTIDLINKPFAVSQLHWMLKSAARLEMLDKWIKVDIGIFKLFNPLECKCSPSPPALRWRRINGPKPSQSMIKPFEIPTEALDHQRHLRSRPPPVRSQLECANHTASLIIEFNLATLIHRVLMRFSDYSKGTTTVQWCLANDDGFHTPTIFPQLSLPGYERDDPQDHQLIQNFDTETKLWPSQLQTLAWMREQESGNARWSEWEYEEVQLPALDWRLDLQADNEKIVRGGILADRVGAGKTVTSFALVAGDKEQNDFGIKDGFIHCSATLILVPGNIINQWTCEMDRLLRKKCTLTIPDIETLQTLKVEEFLDADVILAPWHLFMDDDYWQLMQSTCCAPNYPPYAGRAFKDWLTEALGVLKTCVQASQPFDTSTFDDKFQEARTFIAQDNNGDFFGRFQAFDEKADFPETTSETTLSNLQDAPEGNAVGTPRDDGMQGSTTTVIQNEGGNNSDDEIEESSEEDFAVLPLLHMFNFHRIIVDEFSYLREQALLGVLHLQADRRWMLSATPPITSFDSINLMAKLLGTNVTSRDEKEGVLGFIKGKKAFLADKSSAEQFKAQVEIESPIWTSRKYARAENFVNRFIRQNYDRDANNIERKDALVLTEMSIVEACTYDRMYQLAMSPLVRVPEEKRMEEFSTQDQESASSRRDEAFATLLHNSRSLENALLTCNAELLGQYLGEESTNRSNIEVISSLQQEKQAEFRTLCKEIKVAMKPALENWMLANEPKREDSHFDAFLESVLRHTYGDTEVTNLLCTIIKDVRTPCTTDGKIYETVKKARETQAKQNATLLLSLTRKLVQVARQLRLYEVVLAIANGNKNLFTCCHCVESTPVQNIEIMALCGHVACKDCIEVLVHNSANLDCCPCPGCLSPAGNSRVPASSYSGAILSNRAERFTAKTRSIVSAVQHIVDTSNDLILIFVQHDAHLRELRIALRASHVAFVDACSRANANVTTFLKRDECRARVLMLKIDTEDAAGWNLHICNHVMFLSPYLTNTSYDYTATMEQAVGRCLRHRQQKTVYVYHFLTKRTIEIEIFQKRQKKVVGRRSALDPYELFTVEEATELGLEDLGDVRMVAGTT